MSSYLEINLNHLKENYLFLKKKYSQKIIFVIKANAYGFGSKFICPFIYQELGIKDFACARKEEAYEILNSIENFKGRIFILSDLDLIHDDQCYSNIFSFHQLQYELPKNFSLKLDIGLNRLGFSLEELPRLIPLLKEKNITIIPHLMGHYSAKKPIVFKEEEEELLLQRKRFNQAYEILSDHFKIIETSLAKSSASFFSPLYENTHYLRLGLSFYGLYFPEGKLPLNIQAQIIKKKFVKKNTPVGYQQNKTEKEGYLYTLSLGYADGLSPFLAHKKYQNFTFQGSISMDLTTIFSENNLGEEGSYFPLWNNEEEFLQFQELNQIKPHAFFCGLGHRLQKKYLYNNKEYYYEASSKYLR